jgi:hypothetical protein
MTNTEQEFPLADRTIPAAMLARAYNDLRRRCIRFEMAAQRVARLNALSNEIGSGMLATIVEEANAAIEL